MEAEPTHTAIGDGGSVTVIAQNGSVTFGKVNANLMGASGVQACFHQVDLFSDSLKVGEHGFGVFGSRGRASCHAAPNAVPAVGDQVIGHRPCFSGRGAVDERHVPAFHRMRFQLRFEVLLRGFIAGHHEQTAGALIDAVHGQRSAPCQFADQAQGIEVTPLFRSRDTQHASGFPDHNQIVVSVHDDQVSAGRQFGRFGTQFNLKRLNVSAAVGRGHSIKEHFAILKRFFGFRIAEPEVLEVVGESHGLPCIAPSARVAFAFDD